MPIIAISGHPAAGKTVLANKLAPALGFENFYMGQIFRDLAAEAGLDINEFYKKLKEDPELEKSIDQKQIELMQTKNNLVIQGRMTPFLPCVFGKINILLQVDAKTAARRLSQDEKNKGKSLEELESWFNERIRTERARYRKLYGEIYGIEDHFDPKRFDIVIDTTLLTPEKVLEIALDSVEIIDDMEKMTTGLD